jgi:hypothetical protein
VKQLLDAGLNSIRVSLNSAQEPWYNAYYKPRGYGLAQLKESLKAAVGAGAKASINYFVFPGVSDREREVEALLDLISETGLHLVQWRNLNLDPDLYLKTLGGPEALLAAGDAIGVTSMLEEIRLQHPKLRFGYFNPAWGYEDHLDELARSARGAAQAWAATHGDGTDKLGTC